MNSILKIIDENLHVIDQSIQSRRKIETEKNQKMVLSRVSSKKKHFVCFKRKLM